MLDCDRRCEEDCCGYDPFQSGKMRMLMMVLMAMFVVMFVCHVFFLFDDAKV